MKAPLGTGSSKQSWSNFPLSHQCGPGGKPEVFVLFCFVLMKCEGIFFADEIQNQFVSVCLRYPAAHRLTRLGGTFPRVISRVPEEAFRFTQTPRCFTNIAGFQLSSTSWMISCFLDQCGGWQLLKLKVQGLCFVLRSGGSQKRPNQQWICRKSMILGQHHFPGDFRAFLSLGGFVSRRVKGTVSCCPVPEE